MTVLRGAAKVSTPNTPRPIASSVSARSFALAPSSAASDTGAPTASAKRQAGLVVRCAGIAEDEPEGAARHVEVGIGAGQDAQRKRAD
ncbi:MAG: hypothetical protein H6891_09240 [Brucellaceae bacterium]|nr:hypothetical protein [Brucellaceae bacterium]